MGPRPTNLTPEVASKYREVMRLRVLGMTFDIIADRVGYSSRQGAFGAAEREAIEVSYGVGGAEERVVVFATDVLAAVSGAINVSRRKSSLLGLDAPRQLELAGVEGAPFVTDIGELLRERMEAVAPGSTETPPTGLAASQNGSHNGVIEIHEQDDD